MPMRIAHDVVLSLSEKGMEQARHFLDRRMSRVEKQMEEMMSKVDDLIEKVGEVRGVQQSVLATLTGVIELLNASKGDDAKIQQAIADLEAGKQEMAAAIIANPDEPPAAKGR